MSYFNHSFSEWTKLVEPSEKAADEKTDSDLVSTDTPLDTTSEKENKPMDEEMKDIEESKPATGDEEQVLPEEQKEEEKPEEAAEEKQEIIPPPADTPDDLEPCTSNKRKSPRKITKISLDGEEYRKNFGTIMI